MEKQRSFDCVVIGGGPTGLATAAALGAGGLSVAIVDEPQQATATQALKTAALFPPAVTFIKRLGAWKALAPVAEPMTGLRLADDTGGLLRAPEILFRADEIGLATLAHNVPNAELTAALQTAADAMGVTSLFKGRASAIEMGTEHCIVRCADSEELQALFVVGSDGRGSPTRQAAGIEARTWSYDQSALITTFDHSRPHRGISTELHGPAGPCTTVPLRGRRSSLVWVDRPARIAALMDEDGATFSASLEQRLAGLLGSVCAGGPRRSFPMAGLMADRMARGPAALVGEAGHALPPIGAQGLNLGLADAAVLAGLVTQWHRGGRKMAIAVVLARYAQEREADIQRRSTAVDLLNRSLDAGNSVVRLARGAGLHLLAAVPPARRLLIARGLEAPSPVPELMMPVDEEAASRSAVGRRLSG